MSVSDSFRLSEKLKNDWIGREETREMKSLPVDRENNTSP